MGLQSWILLVCLFKFTVAYAQNSHLLSNAGYVQIGVYQVTPSHALLAGVNQGVLSKYKQFTATAYGEKRFMLDDLSFMQFGMVLPVKESAFGVQASSFGSAALNKSSVGTAYGRSLSSRMHVGVQFNYLHYRIAGYGNAHAVNAEAGILYNISETVTGGLHVYNPAGQSFFGFKEAIVPRVVSAGFGYAPSQSFYGSLTFIKEKEQALNVQAAMQYKVMQKLVVKGGITTLASQFYFGIGYQLPQLQLEASAALHPQLGISPALMITYKKED